MGDIIYLPDPVTSEASEVWSERGCGRMLPDPFFCGASDTAQKPSTVALFLYASASQRLMSVTVKIRPSVGSPFDITVDLSQTVAQLKQAIEVWLRPVLAAGLPSRLTQGSLQPPLATSLSASIFSPLLLWHGIPSGPAPDSGSTAALGVQGADPGGRPAAGGLRGGGRADGAPRVRPRRCPRPRPAHRFSIRPGLGMQKGMPRTLVGRDMPQGRAEGGAA
jgi:hypothetical protein